MLLPENKAISLELQNNFKDLISNYEMSFAVVDLNDSEPKIFGYNLDHFIYPASMYKVFIGAEVLRRIEIGDFKLDQKIVIKSPNDVDKDSRIFPGDTRTLLHAGDDVMIDYLLDLMLTRSDNTASNCLIDLVGRESITQNIIYKNGWQGSDVTRKFLDRTKDAPYQFSSTTMSCARHFAEFFYLVETGKLESEFVSKKLKEYMLRFNKSGRQGTYVPSGFKTYYCKGGWLETNLYKNKFSSLLKAVFTKGWAIIRWSNDAGVAELVTGERYVVIVFSVTKTLFPWRYFPIQDFGRRVMEYMKK